ncbi:MAG: hypothetical protein ACNS62_21010 [Candidatus Cyclobacteriaceae bacterium M3_2C_046]
MKKLIFNFIFSSAFLMFFACGQSTDVVDSGTYQGTIQEVEPDKTEIYVRTSDGQVLELYFTEQTTLTQNGNEIDFSMLEEGDQVEVEVEKVGQRLDPISVKLME